MNLGFWNKLPSELQKIYLEVGEDAKWWCCKTGKSQTASLLEKMRAAGMKALKTIRLGGGGAAAVGFAS